MERRPQQPWNRSLTASARSRAARWGAAALIGLSALLAGLAPPLQAGDHDLAEFLLEGGKKAIQKRQYDDGIARLEKALAEDEGVIEAHYWIGYAEEKRGDPAAAVAAYRRFREACKGCESKLERGLSNLLRKAESRLRVLAAAEIELAKLNESFIRDVLALAKTSFVRDPALARRAVHLVLALDPGHPEALKLTAKLGGESTAAAGGADEEADPAKEVATWDDFLARSLFGTNDGWSYANGRLRIHDEGQGSFVTPKRAYASPKDFVYEIEGKIEESFGNWCLGVCFAKHESSWFACHFSRAEVVLWRVMDAARSEDIVRHPIDPLELDTWHRLTVAAKGNRLDVYLDGKKQFSHVHDGLRNFGGDVGTFHQRNRCEIRVLRMGARK